MLFHAAHTSTDGVDILLGEPKEAIRKMVVPIFVALIVVQLNNFVDNIWCSSLGVEAVSAVSLVSTLYFFFPSAGAGLGLGLNVTISNAIGAGNDKGASDRASQMFALTAIVVASLIPLLLFCMDPLIDLIGGASIKGLCREYLLPLFVLCPFLVLSNVMAGMLRGEGRARESTILNVAMAVTNLVLDPIFIFSLDMGVAGASWATMLSSVVAVSIGLWYYFSGRTYVKLRFKGMRFQRECIGDVMYVGAPQVLENNIHSMANLLLMSLIIGCGGALGLTLYNVPWKTVHLLMVPAMAMASSMVPVISAARGQRDPGKMREAYRYSLKMELALGLGAMAAAFLLGDFWMLLFSYNGDMAAYHDELVRILWIYIPFMVFYGLISFGSSLLGAMKKSQISAATILVRQAVFVGIIFVCCQHDMEWVYWGVTVSEIIGGVLMMAVAKSEFGKGCRELESPSDAAGAEARSRSGLPSFRSMFRMSSS